MPRWSLDGAMSLVDLVGIRTAMLSVATPGTVPARDPAEAAVVACDVNDFAASLVSDRPDRFGLFATVPLPDVGAATSEAIRALDHLSADGLILLANAAGGNLGSPAHDELRRTRCAFGGSPRRPGHASGPARGRRPAFRG